MVQKKQQRPSPLDDPPTASSSDSEEEEQRPSSEQRHAEDEEVASSEEEEDSSEEDDDDDEEHNPKPASQNPPPPPTNSLPKPSSSESETDSDSGSDSEPDPNPNPKVKPLASKPMEQAQKPKAHPSPTPSKSGSKRAAENHAHVTGPKRAKKKATDFSGGGSDEEVEEDGKKSGELSKKFQRIWSEEDELAILKGMVDFTSNTGQDPFKYANAFHDFMKKSLHFDASSNQLKEKIRRLKKKFETNSGKGKNGNGPKFSKPHDQKSYELSKKVWGNEQVETANGAIEKEKSNGKAAKSPKKEASGSRNVATSGKKLKPETKPEPERISEVLTESGKMDIDPKPDGDTGLLLSEMFCYQNGGGGVYRLNEDDAKRGLQLIGESKRAELEAKWKKIRAAEMKLYADRALLVGEQTSLILEALQPSNH
ncbi:probable transcription factor At1g11510 [Abrus precatorius]|uniref:Probable transcription factor At1g11510 n=1 Tax=Abrus precatorius TaxID=3816 RepID=A0A8B8JF56_ABRPR|nr:probable transcription factor At1g11510 [Abrus precatorius]XP_027329849.1 probable transcription factor At1g11510 [Abrus precatorius]XP_027329858.1 probable transcription factor At1g11510 [Abrus precatorius]